MKNPNGYGCIKKLSGHRRRPYVFVVTEAGRQRVVGAFPTQIEALIFQTDYNRSHPNCLPPFLAVAIRTIHTVQA